MGALVQIENDTIREFMLMGNAARPLNLRAFAYCHAVATKNGAGATNPLGRRSQPKAVRSQGDNHAAISPAWRRVKHNAALETIYERSATPSTPPPTRSPSPLRLLLQRCTFSGCASCSLMSPLAQAFYKWPITRCRFGTFASRRF